MVLFIDMADMASLASFYKPYTTPYLAKAGFIDWLHTGIHAACLGTVLVAVAFFVGYWSLQYMALFDNEPGHLRKVMPFGFRRLMSLTIVVLVATIVLTWLYNNQEILTEAQALAQSCECTLWRSLLHHHNNTLDQVNNIIESQLQVLKSALLISERERHFGVFRVDQAGVDPADYESLRRHLWSVVYAYNTTLRMSMLFGYHRLDQLFLAYWVRQGRRTLLLCDALPGEVRKHAFNGSLQAYAVDDWGNYTEFLGRINIDPVPWTTIRNEEWPFRMSLGPGSSFSSDPGDEEMRLTASKFSKNASGHVTGLWGLQVDKGYITDAINKTLHNAAGNNAMFALASGADLTVISAVPPLPAKRFAMVNGTKLYSVAEPVLAEIGGILHANGPPYDLFAPVHVHRRQGYPDALYIVGSYYHPGGWVSVMATALDQMNDVFDPQWELDRMVRRFAAIDALAAGTYALVGVTTALLYFSLLLRDKHVLRKALKPVAVFAWLLLCAAIAGDDALLNVEYFQWPEEINRKCREGLEQVANDSLQFSSRSIETGLRARLTQPSLINELLTTAVTAGKLPVDRLDRSPAQRQLLLDYQWMYFSVFESVSFVYGAAVHVYGGYFTSYAAPGSTAPAVSYGVWGNATLGANPYESTVEMRYVDNGTGAPYGPLVDEIPHYWMQEQDWYRRGARLGTKRSIGLLHRIVYANKDYTTENDTRGQTIATVRQVPKGPNSTAFGMVSAADFAPQALTGFLTRFSSNEGLTFIVDADTSVLVAGTRDLELVQNGKLVRATESSNALVSQSFRQLYLRDLDPTAKPWSFSYYDIDDDGAARREQFFCATFPYRGHVPGLDLIVVSVLAFDDWIAQVGDVRQRRSNGSVGVGGMGMGPAGRAPTVWGGGGLRPGSPEPHPLAGSQRDGGGGGAEDGGVWAAKTVERPPQQPAQPPTHQPGAAGTSRHIQHSPGTPTAGLRERGNDTSRSTGRSGRQNAATRRNMRRDERVTVQGPVKIQQPDGMSHRGWGGGGAGDPVFPPWLTPTHRRQCAPPVKNSKCG